MSIKYLEHRKCSVNIITKTDKQFFFIEGFFLKLELSQVSGLVLPEDKEMGKITYHAPS